MLLLYRSLILAPEGPGSPGGSSRGGGGVEDGLVRTTNHATAVVEVIDVTTHANKVSNHTGRVELVAAQVSVNAEPIAAEKENAAESSAAATAIGGTRNVSGESGGGREGAPSTVGVDGGPADPGIVEMGTLTPDQHEDIRDMLGQLDTEVRLRSRRVAISESVPPTRSRWHRLLVPLFQALLGCLVLKASCTRLV